MKVFVKGQKLSLEERGCKFSRFLGRGVGLSAVVPSYGEFAALFWPKPRRAGPSRNSTPLALVARLCLDNVVDQLVRKMHCENDDFCARKKFANLAGGFEPVQFGHSDVHNYYVRLELLG
jgi:hypothetical protein